MTSQTSHDATAREAVYNQVAPEPVTPDPIARPILNKPHEEPTRHWKLAEDNTSTGEVINERRLSQSLLIMPKERGSQLRMQTTTADQNELVNDIREGVSRWRKDGYLGATTASRQLLRHWRSEANDPRLFFAQVEAVETLIWLTEANATRYRVLSDIRRRLRNANSEYNNGIYRLAVRMATGTGKTTVMGMVIAWHAVNAATSMRRDRRYTTHFLAITPGHTVRERLAVLNPTHPHSIYNEMRLLPENKRNLLNAVKVKVLNFQAFQCKDKLGDIPADAKKLLRRTQQYKAYVDAVERADGDADTLQKLLNKSGATRNAHWNSESMSAVFARTLRDFHTVDTVVATDGTVGKADGTTSKKAGASQSKGSPHVCVLNDEAHHCYLPEAGLRGADGDDTGTAAIWFNALEGLRKENQLGAVYDFSATPIFIEGTERKERMFPWVVSDFPLMDSIESGLVKIPQVPVDDDSADGRVKWRNLYVNTKPKRVKRDNMPSELKRALEALYASYEQKFRQWMHPEDIAQRMPTPPVFIVVANNIANATAISEYIAGWAEKQDDGHTVFHPGACPLFANYTHTGTSDRVHTLLVHSQLEKDSHNLSKAVKAQAERLRLPGDTRIDREIVRGALNSVGKSGGLGEHIRCVVSVQMLTEGWDTRTVTHVLGFRAFTTQLLCEQVTGRALRRSNYDNYDGDGKLMPEYAEVIGVPFEFMPVKPDNDNSSPPKPRYEVRSIAVKRAHRIDFPNVEHYLTELGGGGFRLNERRVIRWVPQGTREVLLSGSVGDTRTIAAQTPVRPKHALINLAAQLVKRWSHRMTDSNEGHRARRKALFHDAYRIVKRWIELAEVTEDHYSAIGSSNQEQAVNEIDDACEPANGTQDRFVATFGHPVLMDTSGVSFETSLQDRHITVKSELDIAACHSQFEVACAKILDNHADVDGWARNFRLGWTIPYLWEGEWRCYEPDFVARLFASRENETAVHLIIECKGVPDDHSKRKNLSVTESWIPAVAASNRLPRWLRRWTFVSLTEPGRLSADLNTAIRRASTLTAQVAAGRH